MRTSPVVAFFAAVLGCVGAGSQAAAQRFTVVALPDTQFYSERPEWTYHFGAQTQWCVDHKDEWDIAFVTHLGDVVQHASEVGEWQRADASVDHLDGEQQGVLRGPAARGVLVVRRGRPDGDLALPGPPRSAGANGDGAVNTQDVLAYLSLWAVGC